MKEASFDFKTTGRQRKDMFRSRMRCDPKQNARWQKFHNNMIDSSTPFLDQPLWQYLCFAKQFRSLVILRMFWRQNDRWQAPSQIELDSWNSCICSTEMVEDPTMISHLLSGLYHLENDGCMGSVRVRKKSGIWQMLVVQLGWQKDVNLGKDTWVAGATVRLD